MNPRQSAENVARRKSRWVTLLITVPLFALTPKCFLCLLAYAGLGATLGLGGPELCGAPAGSSSPWLPLLGMALGVTAFAKRILCRRSETSRRS